MQTLSPSLAEQSGSLPSFEELEELDLEEDELTIRRVFAPKKPARVAVEVSDADATWKWERPVADSKGRFLALALPTLEDDKAVEFDHSEAEVTREMMSPFALVPGAAAIPLSAARRRVRPIARPRAKRPSFMKRNGARIAMIVAATVVAFALAFFIVRRPTAINLGMSAGLAEGASTIDLPPISNIPLQGTIVPAKGTAAKGQPLYVDGKLVGESDGPVTVDCGTRIVKLGTSGPSRSVAVPCGGEVKISL